MATCRAFFMGVVPSGAACAAGGREFAAALQHLFAPHNFPANLRPLTQRQPPESSP
jgi:hypothetical protein